MGFLHLPQEINRLCWPSVDFDPFLELNLTTCQSLLLAFFEPSWLNSALA